jgi:hypothetical protein
MLTDADGCFAGLVASLPPSPRVWALLVCPLYFCTSKASKLSTNREATDVASLVVRQLLYLAFSFLAFTGTKGQLLTPLARGSACYWYKGTITDTGTKGQLLTPQVLARGSACLSTQWTSSSSVLSRPRGLVVGCAGVVVTIALGEGTRAEVRSLLAFSSTKVQILTPEELLRLCSSMGRKSRRLATGTQFTCFTSTKVQILTRAAALRIDARQISTIGYRVLYMGYTQVLSLVALLVQKYKY